MGGGGDPRLKLVITYCFLGNLHLGVENGVDTLMVIPVSGTWRGYAFTFSSHQASLYWGWSPSISPIWVGFSPSPGSSSTPWARMGWALIWGSNHFSAMAPGGHLHSCNLGLCPLPLLDVGLLGSLLLPALLCLRCVWEGGFTLPPPCFYNYYFKSYPALFLHSCPPPPCPPSIPFRGGGGGVGGCPRLPLLLLYLHLGVE